MAHLAPELAQQLAGKHGFRMAGRAIVAVRCDDWWRGAEPAMQTATSIVARPLFETMRSLDITSPERLSASDGTALERARELFTFWLYQPETIWDE